jgi:hypothetical protein
VSKIITTIKIKNKIQIIIKIYLKKQHLILTLEASQRRGAAQSGAGASSLGDGERKSGLFVELKPSHC